MSPARDVFDCALRRPCRYWRGSSSTTCDSTSGSRDRGTVRAAALAGRQRYAESVSPRRVFGDDPAPAAVVLVHHRGGTRAIACATGTDVGWRQVAARLDLPRELVAQIDATSRRVNGTRVPVCDRRIACARPRASRNRHARSSRRAVRSLATRDAALRAWMREQDVEARLTRSPAAALSKQPG